MRITYSNEKRAAPREGDTVCVIRHCDGKQVPQSMVARDLVVRAKIGVNIKATVIKPSSIWLGGLKCDQQSKGPSAVSERKNSRTYHGSVCPKRYFKKMLTARISVLEIAAITMLE